MIKFNFSVLKSEDFKLKKISFFFIVLETWY